MIPQNAKVVDADGQVLGRFCTKIAKAALLGETIAIINAEKVVITGSRAQSKARYVEEVAKGDTFKGPFFPTRPDLVLKRTIRGMLPYKQERGRKA
ncbi:50S ribosomal protein L13, partial [Candidatus Woesearchaeota archaeon CG11_big_fil_rev_8_21_14_0_20_57_5]